MSNTDIIRWKRILNELSFLHEEVELIDSIISEYNSSFQQYYEEFCAKHEIDIDNLNKENYSHINELFNPPAEEDLLQSSDEEPADLDRTEMKNIFSKLFKAIAMKLHPDKLSSSLTNEERDDMINMFNKAKEALDEERYFILLDLASKFKIKTPKNYKQQVRWMKKEAETMKTEIDTKKTTYSYEFSECENDEQKDDLVRKFIKHLFNIDV